MISANTAQGYVGSPGRTLGTGTDVNVSPVLIWFYSLTQLVLRGLLPRARCHVGSQGYHRTQIINWGKTKHKIIIACDKDFKVNKQVLIHRLTENVGVLRKAALGK